MLARIGDSVLPLLMKVIADRIRRRFLMNRSSARQPVTLDPAMPGFANFPDRYFGGVRGSTARGIPKWREHPTLLCAVVEPGHSAAPFFPHGVSSYTIFRAEWLGSRPAAVTFDSIRGRGRLIASIPSFTYPSRLKVESFQDKRRSAAGHSR
jgi:hypothetical protein